MRLRRLIVVCDTERKRQFAPAAIGLTSSSEKPIHLIERLMTNVWLQYFLH